MKTKFFDGRNLDDKAILSSLHRAAELYEDGAIVETADLLTDVIAAIGAFTKHEEEHQ